MKFSFIKPYSLYNMNFKFRHTRDLLELEAILLTSLYYSNNNKSLNIWTYFENILNLNSTKWSEFIFDILKNMNNNEIKFPNTIPFKDLLVGDIEIHTEIQKSIENDKFYGMENKDQIKQMEFLMDLQNTSNIIQNTNISTYNIKYLSNILIRKNIENNEENKIKCIEEMLNNKKDGILKDVEVINKDDYEKGTNIIFSDWNNQFECTEIDLQNNVINIPDKKFYEYIARMEELDTLNIILKYFEQNINNKNIEFLPISNLTNQNPILNFDDYNLISNFIENNKKMNNQLNNIGIYKKQVCLFYLKQEKFQINNNDLLVFNMNKIYYSILENEIQLMKIIQETYDVIDWVDWITKIDDVNQKEIIKKYILENYIELSQINNYKKFIINNFEYINKIKSEWIFSDLININDFQKMANINNIKIINILTSSSIHSFENSDINGINKINYLFNEYGFSLNDLNNPSLEVKHDLEIINEITRLQNSNNINLIKEAINKREKVFFTESENKYKELESKYNQLIKENKDLIIEEIYNLMSKQIIGKLDEFLRKLSNNLNTKSSLHDNLKIIEEKKILNKNTIEKLRWIKDERNKFAHSSETMFKDTLLESSLEFLNDYHSKLKIIIEEMEKRNNESFN